MEVGYLLDIHIEVGYSLEEIVVVWDGRSEKSTPGSKKEVNDAPEES